jgi:hypothetical protein
VILPHSALVERWQPAIPKMSTAERGFLWRVFGIGADKLADRDYRTQLVGLKTSTTCILGDPNAVLPPPMLPSLVDQEGEAILAAQPCVRVVRTTGVGHDVGQGASEAIVQALRALIGAQENDHSTPTTSVPGGTGSTS